MVDLLTCRFRIRNFSRFQKFQRKRARYIQWHTEALNKPEWMGLTLGAQGLIVSLSLIAATDEGPNGITPTGQEIAWRLRKPPKTVLKFLNELVSSKWVVVYDDPTLPLRHIPQDCADSAQSESERERNPYMVTADAVTAWDGAFDTHFWPDYPRKVKKREARAAWNKLRPKNADDFRARARAILELLDERKPEWETRPPDKVPHPASFLNAEEFS